MGVEKTKGTNRSAISFVEQEFAKPIDPKRKAKIVADFIKNVEGQGKPSGSYTKAIQVDYNEIHTAVHELIDTKQFTDVNKFGLLMNFTRVDLELAKMLVDELEIYDKNIFDLLILAHKNKAQIASNYFEGRNSIVAHVTHNEIPIEDKKYKIKKKDSSGKISEVGIRTIFDIGRLCPPKCK